MKKNLHLRRLCCLALLTAVEIVLNRFCSINTSALKIGFSFVPIVVAASVFGPLGGAVSSGLADLIGAILFPIGTYHPGFTVCAALMGFTYGIFLCTPNKWSGKFALKWKKIRFFPNVIVPAVVVSDAGGFTAAGFSLTTRLFHACSPTRSGPSARWKTNVQPASM